MESKTYSQIFFCHFFFMALGLNMQGKLSASVITVVFNQWEAVVQINTLFN